MQRHFDIVEWPQNVFRTDVVDYLYTYAIDNRTMIVYDNMKTGKKL